jgi:DNA-binding MarR family transcriptional regulator
MEPTFGYLVSDVARLLRKKFDRKARHIGVSLAQCRALVYLARHEGINQAGLADLLEIHPITLVRLIDRMEAAGWIERRADPADRRAHRLYLSEKAHPLLDRIHVLAAHTRGQALAGLADSERDNLVQLLARVHGNLSSRECPAEGE